MKVTPLSNKSNTIVLGRMITIFLFVAVVAGTWDAWWHGAIGRDSFWEPPHLLLYSSVIAAVAFGIYGYVQSREKIWRTLAIILLLVPLSAPFDELWHRIFGVEDLSSPLIIWSPPHLAIIFSIMASMIMLLPIIRKDSKDMQVLFGSMTFASLLNLILFLFAPLQPEGPWHLLGYFGTFFIGAATIGIMVIAQRWIPQPGAAILTAVFFLSIAAIGFNEKIAEGITILPHDHPPAFLTIFAILLAATVLISLETRWKGALAGFIWAGVIYGFSWMFFKPQFIYTFSEGAVGIIFGTVGAGSITFIISEYISRKGE